MNRWALSALVLSLALNLGFGLAWIGHQRVLASRHEGPPPGLHADGHGPLHLRRHSNGEWAQRRAHRLHRELGLDEPRREQLRASLEPLEPEIADTRRELLRARRGFADALHVEEPDRAKVMLLRSEVSQLQAQLDSLVAEALLRESRILDPEERQRSGPWSSHHRDRPSHEEKRR
mgnify:CR=1 FL=1